MSKKIIAAIVCIGMWAYSFAQKNKMDSLSKEAAKTEVWAPVPPIIKPGANIGDAPSDAIILFDGSSLDKWCGSDNAANAAKWTVANGCFTVKKGTGNIQTKQSFTDYQLHLEWRIPEMIHGEGQGRGNSGLFLASPSKGEGYELQILDCYENKTYVNGQTGSIYKQIIPLANSCKKPGEWQVYDVIWTAPRFNSDGTLLSAARVTAILNGVLLQNNTEVKGLTQWIGAPVYVKHGAAPIMLQDHGDPSEPISFKNIWIRPL